jgi:hypothetical protein
MGQKGALEQEAASAACPPKKEDQQRTADRRMEGFS